MADTTVLREFLVSLGFKADGLDKFQTSLDKATKTIGLFGSAIEGMATAAAKLTTDTAGKFENLYYAAQRLHTSVGAIKAFQYAISQLGGTTQGARSSMEGMADALRKNPGLQAMLRGFGVTATGAPEMLKQFGKFAATKPYYIASQYAQMLGIDDQTLQALIRGSKDGAMDKRLDDYNKMTKQAGIDQQAAAAASAAWAQNMRKLLNLFDIFKDKILISLQKPVGMVVELIEKAHKATNGWSTGFLVLLGILLPMMLVFGPMGIAITAIAAALGAAAIVLPVFMQNWKGVDWGSSNSDIQALLQDLKQLQPLFEAIGNFLKNNFAPALKDFGEGALRSVRDILHEVVEAIEAVKAAARGDWKAAGQHAKNVATSALHALVINPAETAAKAVGHLTGKSKETEGFVKNTLPNVVQQGGSAAIQGMTKLLGNSNMEKIMHFFSNKGLPAQSIAGIMAGMFAESGMNPNVVNPTSGAYGIGQWLGKRKKDLFKMFGPHPGLEQQLAFMWRELTGADPGGKAVLGAHGAEAAMTAYVKRFMRPAPGAETTGDLKRGRAWLNQHGNLVQGGPVINQETNINVYGSGDPHMTANAVGNQQDRVNSNMVRWNKNAAS